MVLCMITQSSGSCVVAYGAMQVLKQEDPVSLFTACHIESSQMLNVKRASSVQCSITVYAHFHQMPQSSGLQLQRKTPSHHQMLGPIPNVTSHPASKQRGGTCANALTERSSINKTRRMPDADKAPVNVEAREEGANR